MAEVQLTVSVTGDSNSVNLSLPSAGQLGISEDSEKATAAAFLGCLRKCAEDDKDLTPEQAHVLRLEPRDEDEAANEIARW